MAYDDTGKAASNSNSKSKDILETAMARFKLVSEAEVEVREEAMDDLKFRAGDQWPDKIRQKRENAEKPCITINKMKEPIKQVTNGQRENRPSIRVSPVDDDADVETAEILQGLIRHIERDSMAKTAYDTSFEAGVTHGRGYFRILTEYEDPMSFDQVIKIKRIKNAFSVFMDPSCQEFDYSDAEWGFIVTDMTKEAFKQQYPDSDMASLNDWEAVGVQHRGWVNSDSVRVAEYFYKEYEDDELLMTEGGNILRSELPKMLQSLGMREDQITILDKRKTKIVKVKWCKISSMDILSESDWPGTSIPIIPVMGDEYDLNGKLKIEGLVRQAKDPQRMYNYWASNETETIAMSPKAPWVAAEGQIENHEEEWATANVENHSVLKYKPESLSGTMVPPPSRNVFEPPIQAITMARMQSSEDIKSTTGVFDASVGALGPEQSGVAIQRRNGQIQTGNLHYSDNFTVAITRAGKILIELIPKIYNTQRALMIVGEDGTEKVVNVNRMEDGEDMVTFAVGKYDVTVDAGPSYATKRQEAVDSMVQLTSAYPEIFPIAGDLMVKNMDWPGAKDIADRLKKRLPPGLAEPEDGEKPEMPPEIAAQFEQMQLMIQQLTEAANKETNEREMKNREIESKERIAFSQIKAKLLTEAAGVEDPNLRAVFVDEISALDSRLDLTGINDPVDDEEQQMAAAQQGMEQQGMEQGMPQGGLGPEMGSPEMGSPEGMPIDPGMVQDALDLGGGDIDY